MAKYQVLKVNGFWVVKTPQGRYLGLVSNQNQAIKLAQELEATE